MTSSSSLLHHLTEKCDELYEALFTAQEALEEGSFFDSATPGLDSHCAGSTKSLGGFEPHICRE